MANSLPPARQSPSPTGDFTHYKKLGLLLTLYLAQGLPAGFITQALPAILRNYQVSLVAIGWSGLILLPWGLKFLWAPLVDSHYTVRLGRARSWILPLQLLSVVVLVAVAWFNPIELTQAQAVMRLYAMLFVLSLIGATHDVAADGLATRLFKVKPQDATDSTLKHPLSPSRIDEQHQQSQGNAVQVIGYRLGLIVGGGVLLMLLDKIGWRMSFLAMAGLVLINTLPIAYYREPATRSPSQSTHLTTQATPFSLDQLWSYIQRHYGYFWSSREMLGWLGVLITYKIADGISSGMVKPMMVDIGIGLDKIGFWVTILGSAASLLGAAVATVLMKHLTRFQALLGFNALQALTTGLYGVAAFAYHQHWVHSFGWVYAINALEHFCASLALIAMLTTVMHYARHEHAGSDFTVQVCLLTVLGGSAHFLSGYMAHSLGYTQHFLCSMVIGLFLLIPIILWHKWQK